MVGLERLGPKYTSAGQPTSQLVNEHLNEDRSGECRIERVNGQVKSDED